MRFELKHSRNLVWIGGVSLILVSTLIAYLFPVAQIEDLVGEDSGQEEVAGSYRILGWKLLQKLDYKNSSAPPDLRAFIGGKVRIPGFAVPLSSDFRSIEEFLLVPNQLACIHVPPPPPNLMLYVYLKHPATMEELSGPIWLEGTLELKETKSVYGSAAWEIRADKVSPYEIGQE